MFYLYDTADFFNQIFILSICFYLVFSICFSVTFSGIQQIGFLPQNNTSLSNTLFVLLILILSFFTLESGNFYSFSFSSFVSSFYTDFFQVALLISASSFIFLSKEYTKTKKIFSFEYDLIIGFSILGLALVNSCDDFLTFYLAIELQSLCFYVLAAFNKSSEYSVEAGIKYFVLGALSSGLLLFAFALLYLSIGVISFESIEKTGFCYDYFITGCAYIFFSVTLLFKLGAFPFHMWLCDIYDGSILNITAFFSTVPKLILLSFFLKVLFVVFGQSLMPIFPLIAISGLGSICFASTAALYQKRMKRLMAYSTVSHTGFLVLALHCATVDSVKACSVYIVLYILMTMVLFSILLYSGIENSNQKYILNWTGLFEKNLAIGIGLSILLCSIAGIPPLAGFYSKLCVFLCLLSQSHVGVTAIIAVFSSIACFYYIRVIKILFFSQGTRSSFWFGAGTKNIEFFISFGLVCITFFLARPVALLNTAVILSLSLV